MAALSRNVVAEGYLDTDREDWKEDKPEDELFRNLQALQLRIIEDVWAPNEGVRDTGMRRQGQKPT